MYDICAIFNNISLGKFNNIVRDLPPYNQYVPLLSL